MFEFGDDFDFYIGSDALSAADIERLHLLRAIHNANSSMDRQHDASYVTVLRANLRSSGLVSPMRPTEPHDIPEMQDITTADMIGGLEEGHLVAPEEAERVYRMQHVGDVACWGLDDLGSHYLN